MRLEGKLCIFPGIPRLFQRMLDGLVPFLPLPPPSERPCRQQVFTKYVIVRFRLLLLITYTYGCGYDLVACRNPRSPHT